MESELVSFSPELMDFIEKWKGKPGSLIMLLHRVQEEFRYIPLNVAERLAKMINMPLAKIYGVITFYHFFKTKKPGENRISICLGTACYLKGSQNVLDEAYRLLSIKDGETTADGLFSVDAVRCIGCCGLAPVITIGSEVYGKVTKEQFVTILSKYQHES
jgi:NADH-quinone oxidoreductase subunit E